MNTNVRTCAYHIWGLKMLKKMTVTLLSAVVIVGCGAKNQVVQQKEPEKQANWSKLKTIELVDQTSSILIGSTNVKIVGELFEAGLKDKGYKVCRECNADARLELKVEKFISFEDYSRGWLTLGMTTLRKGEVSFQYRMVEKGTGLVFVDNDQDDEENSSVNEISGRLVLKAMKDFKDASAK